MYYNYWITFFLWQRLNYLIRLVPVPPSFKVEVNSKNLLYLNHWLQVFSPATAKKNNCKMHVNLSVSKRNIIFVKCGIFNIYLLC
jgi:hypothetical protein